MEKLVLVDGHSIINRAFYGVPELTNSAGLHTNAVYGFLNILFKILDEEQADYLAVAFDLPAPTFRHEKFPEYKGTRKPMPDELREQVPLLKEVLGAMQIPTVSVAGYEADDVIGTLAKRFQQEGLEVSVVSGDRDLLQLSDEHILIRIPKTSRGQTQVHDYRPADVKEQYQVTPEEFIDVKGLMGDSSDNIPGVPSIGEKTATVLIAQYHSIENAWAHIDELKPPRAQKALREHYELAQFSKWLATIRLDVPVELALPDMKLGNLYTPEAYEEIKRLEFRSMLKRFDEAARQGDGRKEPEFICVTEKAEAERLKKELIQQPVLGLQLTAHGLSVCASEEQVYIVAPAEERRVETPFGEATMVPAEDSVTEAYLDELLRQLFDSAATVYVTELKSMLHRVGTEERQNLRDCSVAAYLLNPMKDAYRAEDIARDYLELLIPGEKEDARLADYWTGFAAFSAGPVLMRKLREAGMEPLYLETELPLTYALADMELAGIRVDGARLKSFAGELQRGIERTEQEIFSETGTEFNINSPKQLGEVLFEKLGLPYGKKTKSGYSTAADILDKLAPDYPVVKKVLEYRMLTKLNSTYATGLGAYIAEDGRIHGRFNQTITATGRLSSTEPNLQNIPIRTEMGSRIRDVFVPAEGRVFVDADYSQIELRVLASLSGDETLIGAYSHAVDIHAVTASQVFHVPLEEVTPELRRNAKAVNFGVVYGISAFGLSEGLSISRAEAKDYINHYFHTYPKVKQFLDRQIKDAKEKGYTTTLFGRIRPVPELKSSNFMQRAFGERVAMNAPIQGTAADIIKIAMVKVRRRLLAEQLDARIVLQIHDELLVESAEKDAARVLELLRETMKSAAELKVALEVDAHQGHSWLEAH